MTPTLKDYCERAREYPNLFMTFNEAHALCKEIQDEERARGEPVTDREDIAGALLEVLEPHIKDG